MSELRHEHAVTTRPATHADRQQIMELLRRVLGWQDGEGYERLFLWKHVDNPFGPSPAWVATDDTRVIGFRTMLRWEFMLDGVPIRAVRAVDTATDPNYRGLGVFSRLTREALAELEADGISCVFNTPNSQSQPVYLKMGWQVIGKMPLAFRPRSPLSLPRMLTARTPADLWSISTTIGQPADEAFSDTDALVQLLASQPLVAGLHTNRTADFLRWRYAGLGDLAYRVTMPGRSIADGCVIFRLRRRGRAVEAVIADVLPPAGGSKALDAQVRSLRSRTGCDYVLRARDTTSSMSGFVRLPGQGPVVTCRPFGSFPVPPLSNWRLTIGDVELF